jgi:hypothetical protein
MHRRNWLYAALAIAVVSVLGIAIALRLQRAQPPELQAGLYGPVRAASSLQAAPAAPRREALPSSPVHPAPLTPPASPPTKGKPNQPPVQLLAYA